MNMQEMSPRRFIEEVVPLAFAAGKINTTEKRQFTLRLFGENPGEWTLDFGRRKVVNGKTERPHLYMEMSSSDLRAMFTGAFDVDQAICSGRVRVDGDLSLLMAFGELLMSAAIQPSEKNN